MPQESSQVSKTVRLTTAIIGLILVSCFVFGLSYSISTGFAGFEGGLPFAVIAVIVMSMVLYDLYDDCIRKTKK